MADHTLALGTTLVARDSGGDVALTLSALASNYSRKGVVLDFGASWSAIWGCFPIIEWSTAPTAGRLVTVGIAWKHPDGTNYSGAATSADADWQTTAANNLAYFKQIEVVGAYSVLNSASLQILGQRSFTPKGRYGIPIVWNDTDQAFKTATTHLISFRPLTASSA